MASKKEKLIWISDPHMLPRGQPTLGRDSTAAIERAIAYVLEHHRDAALCILSGDLADDGQRSTYLHLKTLLKPLPMPVLPLTGNHDSRRSLIEIMRPPAPAGAETIDYSVEISNGRVICLDTLVPGSDRGQLSKVQLAWLSKTLSAAPDVSTYLFMHHPPLKLGLPMQDIDRLENGDELVAILREHSNVRHMFFGHVHRPISGSIGTIAFTGMGSVLFQAPLPYPDWTWETFAPSGDPPNVGIILLDDRSVVVQFHVLMQE